MKDELSAGRRSVHVFLETPESDALRVQLLNDLNQMRQGPPQPIEFPDDQDIPGSRIAQGLGETGTLSGAA